ncbi:MAG: response regulator [Leptospira sp.]|nr:response regulator [Leptospira sp.]
MISENQKSAIVCVDDEPIILLSLVRELKREIGSEYSFETASNPSEAMEVIDYLCQTQIEVILIVSDWLMPGMNGDEFLREVHKKYPHIKSIMISGHADLKEMEKLKTEANTVAIFSKPWDADELLSAVRNCCS